MSAKIGTKQVISNEDFLINIQHILNCNYPPDKKAQWVLDHCFQYEHGKVDYIFVKKENIK